MDVSTLCSLMYGDVAEGLLKEEHPLKLELHRPKTGTEYNTFLGTNAVEALKAYIADMRARAARARIQYFYSIPQRYQFVVRRL